MIPNWLGWLIAVFVCVPMLTVLVLIDLAQLITDWLEAKYRKCFK